MGTGSQKEEILESPRLENLCSLNSYSLGRSLYSSTATSRLRKKDLGPLRRISE